ncbi:ABC transporter ATP-binding protein [Enterovirga sp. CN4-39]|uniref:ABC transporter ATP-binding protein n=1 Tax=Enterovirga sp. CN4-39 TaxID=3400910 RepID=UPI003C0A515C
MTPLLSVDKLCVAYGRVEAVRDVSLQAPQGSIVAILGPNGAGKTSLLGAIMGVLRSRGEVRFDGRSLDGYRVEQRVADGMSLVPEKRELFVTMSVEDNLRLGGFRRRGSAEYGQTLEEMWRLFPRLKERRAQLAGTLSGGERQMLAMARALMSRPRLLMLDEPSLGLAPLIVKDIFHTVSELRASGVSILLVEQNARAALELADYGYVLENGSVVLEGPASELRQDERVIAAYLGIKAVAS